MAPWEIMAICLLFLAAQTYSFRANPVPRGNVIGVGGEKNVQGCVQMCGRGHVFLFFLLTSWWTWGEVHGWQVAQLPEDTPAPVCWCAGRTPARYHSSHADDISMRKACSRQGEGGTPGSPLSSAGMSRDVCTVWQAEGSRSGTHCSFLYRCESHTQHHTCESVTRLVPPLHCLIFIDRSLTAERTQADQLWLNRSI